MEHNPNIVRYLTFYKVRPNNNPEHSNGYAYVVWSPTSPCHEGYTRAATLWASVNWTKEQALQAAIQDVKETNARACSDSVIDVTDYDTGTVTVTLRLKECPACYCSDCKDAVQL